MRKLISQEQLHFKGIEGYGQGNESQKGGFGHSRSNVGKMTGALCPLNHTPEVAASITDTKGLPCVAILMTFQRWVS